MILARRPGLFARPLLLPPRWVRRQSLRQYLWKWTEVVWTLFSPAVPPSVRVDYTYSIAYPAISTWGVHPRMDFFHFALAHPPSAPVVSSALFSAFVSLLFSRPLYIHFFLANDRFLLAFSLSRAGKNPRAQLLPLFAHLITRNS